MFELTRSKADLKCFTTFHVGLKKPKRKIYTKTRGKILIMHGSADTSITMNWFADLAKKSGIDRHLPRNGNLRGCSKCLYRFGGKRYQETADKKSWKRFTEFLADTLKN